MNNTEKKIQKNKSAYRGGNQNGIGDEKAITGSKNIQSGHLTPLLALTCSSISRIMLTGKSAAPLKGGPSKYLDPVTSTTNPLGGFK